ncbi:hypothetical protein RYZ26_00270 [Terasakiella sp. A23]|uniref:hypothetical protein n=1 Tax=Terasakiella sp. FCG-A23 TaxID=3080561 RepID=UPI002952E280|nr:hypothetical protein [Terasakiella sp. A23]MDV7338007.1 hypothetical protein [Terasakiella sp. A23]
MIGPVSSSISNVGQLYEPQRLTESQNALIQELLSEYDSENLTDADIQAINDTFREEGIVPSRDLRNAIEAAGFDAETLRNGSGGQGEAGNRPPPPPPPPSSTDTVETVKALVNLLEEYGGQNIDQSALNDLQKKWVEAGYTTSGNGSFISIEA